MPERKLAAILFSDIVGYTALMGSDEDKALEILRINRQIHAQHIEQYHGTLIKEMGDGNLVQFPSAAEAVQCAIDIQRSTRDEMDNKIRMGIHLGDVTFENDDVFGDGVNIASRLQSISDPGGIYISESVQKAIRAKSEIHTKYLGQILLKNVSFPLNAYAVQGSELPIPTKEKIRSLTQKGRKKSVFQSFRTYIFIAVVLGISILWLQKNFQKGQTNISSLVFLPFENFTGSDTLDYLMAGMHDALIGEVGKISALRVPGTKTANSYKGVDKSIPEITSELKVDAGVETSVSCFGEDICFQVKVISAFPEERQLWIKEYKVNKSQAQNWYRELAKEISRGISVTLTEEEGELLASTSDTINPAAYDLYLKGKYNLDQINPSSLIKAREYFKRATEIEPDWAAPYAGLAEVGGYEMQMSFVSRETALPLIRENLSMALERDSNSVNSHYTKAVIGVWTEFDWEKGEAEFLKTISLNPNHVRARIFYAHLLTILRRTDEALYHAKIAADLDPQNPFTLGLYADVLIRAANCEAAKNYSEKGLSLEPDHAFAIRELAMAYDCLVDYNSAYAIVKQYSSPLWEMYGVQDHLENIFNTQGWKAFNEEEIRLNEEVYSKDIPLNLGWQNARCLMAGNSEKALEYCEKMYATKDPNFPYISAQNVYDLLKDQPRYIELLRKADLPIN